MNKLLTLLAAIVLPLPSFADLLPSAAEATCATNLVGSVFQSYRGPEDFEFDTTAAITERGYLASVPPMTLGAISRARQQGAIWWGISIKPVRSLEDARAQEARYKELAKGTAYPYDGVSRLTYVIVPDLAEFDRMADAIPDPFTDTQETIDAFQLRARELWRKLTVQPRFFRFDSKDETLVELDPAGMLARFLSDHVEVITSDYRGPRFGVSGWTLPPQQGVAFHSRIFKRKPLTNRRGVVIPGEEGLIAEDSIRKALREVVKFVRAGGKVELTGNADEAVEMATNQLRADENQKVDENTLEVTKRSLKRNSRYAMDPKEKAMVALRLANGTAYAITARTPQGRIVAGGITFRDGNLLSSDTVFYRVRKSDFDPTVADAPAGHPDAEYFDPDHPDVNYSNLARALRIVESSLAYQRAGVHIRGVTMVSAFTAKAGGENIPVAEYLAELHKLNAMPVYDLRLDEPFSLERDLPFTPGEMETWLGKF